MRKTSCENTKWEKDTNRNLKVTKNSTKKSKLFVKKYYLIISDEKNLVIINEEEKEIDELEPFSNVMRENCFKTSAVRRSENIWEQFR